MSPFQGGDTGSNPVGGTEPNTRGCGGVRSPHRPVKAEIAGSKPVTRADLPAASPQLTAVLRHLLPGLLPEPTTWEEASARLRAEARSSVSPCIQ
jgi:hypothetical protein